MGQFSKPWKDLTFSDNFIFCKVMLDKELCKRFIEILLDIKVSKIKYLNTENHIENFYDSHGIRLDVYVKDSKRIFDLEIQTGNYEDLLLRARYYQSGSDVNTTKRKTQYKNLKETFILFICLEDPFGAGIPVYTKYTKFLETDTVPYDDKSHAVFYNASAYKKVTNNDELKAVLRFVYKNQPDSEFTNKLKASSQEAKAHSEWEDDYMYFIDILEEEKYKARKEARAEGRAEGKAEGREEGRAETALNLLKMNTLSTEQISQATGLSVEKIKELETALN